MVTALGVALRKLSDGTNLPEGETLKINRGLGVMTKTAALSKNGGKLLRFLPIMATSKILRTLKESFEATNYKRQRSSLCSKVQRTSGRKVSCSPNFVLKIKQFRVG